MRNLALAILLSISLFGRGQSVSCPERLFLDQAAYEGIFVGVSDPGTDSLTGYWQAVSRAVMLYAFSQDVSVKIVTDFFNRGYNVNGGSRIEEIMESLLAIYTDYRQVSYKIDSVSATPQGEAIVALKVSDDPSGTLFKSAVNLFFNLHSYDGDDDINGKNEIFMQLDTCLMAYELHRYNTEWSCQSTCFGNPVAIDRSRKSYTDTDCTDDSISGYSLENGLWQAFVLSLEDLSSEATNIDCKVKSLQENLGNEVSGYAKQDMRDLTRCVTSHRLKAIPETMCIKDNKLYVDWNVQLAE